MRAFRYDEAVPAQLAPAADASWLAGGTTLLDLMKLDVMRPRRLVSLAPLRGLYSHIEAGTMQLRLGALVRMADAAADAAVRRDYPVIAQSLQLAASAPLRNMATLGGNVLQRTRCGYFRDTAYRCNKREPGSGCAAIGGLTRMHAVLGTSAHCIAAYPGDFAQALIALDAEVELLGADGPRRLPFAFLHREPGDAPHRETQLRPGELITGFAVPARPWTRRSLYCKVRDRASFAFALASAAVALDLHDGIVREVRIALGGVATRPWRALEAERSLRGRHLDAASAREAGRVAFANAVTHGGNAFKTEVGARVVAEALLRAAQLEIAP